MLAKQKEEMGAPLNKREKQARNGIENIQNKASFQNDKWYAACVAYCMRYFMGYKLWAITHRGMSTFSVSTSNYDHFYDNVLGE